MNTFTDKLALVESKANTSYHAGRISAQLTYAAKLSAAKNHQYDNEIEKVLDYLTESIAKEGVITNSAALEGENRLSFLSAEAKKTKIICVSHAHIDMNWQWGYQETVASTLDTFRTMLDLMKEYPQFTFSQSQASVYKIVEEHDPIMLEEIKQRVHEGRWEITASAWVETDKNMPNGESLARHILYTKRYLSRLFGIDPDSLNLDFEPDTFGHNWTVPEILNRGGVKYYYHCRGFDGDYLYKWQSRDGSSVLVYREPKWYNADIEYTMFTDVPAYCKQYGVDMMLKVYGVGDHGGGPTRRDIERIADMSGWTVMPEIIFGTYTQYFSLLEKYADSLPVVNQELNFIFTGCYTSQSRIKAANRISEDKLYQAEGLSAAAALISKRSETDSFAAAWENVLFNHFHDILPGSGVIETREYSMGLFQHVMAVANTNAVNAMRIISNQIDTSDIVTHDDRHSVSEGGGVGYGTDQKSGFRIPQAERGHGKTRIVHFYNPTQFERFAPVEITLWDWNYDISRLEVLDSKGNRAEIKILQNASGYWGHTYIKLAIMAYIPPFGYATYTITERGRDSVSLHIHKDPRRDHISDDNIIMENEHIKAEFCKETMSLISLVDKKKGIETINPNAPAGVLRYIQEDDVYGMTAWRVGQYMKVINLNEACEIKVYEKSLHGIKKWVSYELKYKSSKFNVTISLADNSRTLNFGIVADWHEVGRKGEGVPQLNFFVPLAGQTKKYRYDIPFAVIDRDGAGHDMPGNSFTSSVPSDDKSLPVMVVTDTKYGFRTVDNSIAVNLIRSSYNPDPYPEYGVHNINIGIAVPEFSGNMSLYKERAEFVQTIPYISGTRHTGTLEKTGELFTIKGNVCVAAVKTAEDSKDGSEIILRLSDGEGEGAEAVIGFNKKIKSAYLCDINEKPLTSLLITENTIKVEIKPHDLVSVKIRN